MQREANVALPQYCTSAGFAAGCSRRLLWPGPGSEIAVPGRRSACLGHSACLPCLHSGPLACYLQSSGLLLHLTSKRKAKACFLGVALPAFHLEASKIVTELTRFDRGLKKT